MAKTPRMTHSRRPRLCCHQVVRLRTSQRPDEQRRRRQSSKLPFVFLSVAAGFLFFLTVVAYWRPGTLEWYLGVPVPFFKQGPASSENHNDLNSSLIISYENYTSFPLSTHDYLVECYKMHPGGFMPPTKFWEPNVAGVMDVVPRRRQGCMLKYHHIYAGREDGTTGGFGINSTGSWIGAGGMSCSDSCGRIYSPAASGIGLFSSTIPTGIEEGSVCVALSRSVSKFLVDGLTISKTSARRNLVQSRAVSRRRRKVCSGSYYRQLFDLQGSCRICLLVLDMQGVCRFLSLLAVSDPCS